MLQHQLIQELQRLLRVMAVGSVRGTHGVWAWLFGAVAAGRDGM
jgi:hypothetical protein